MKQYEIFVWAWTSLVLTNRTWTRGYVQYAKIVRLSSRPQASIFTNFVTLSSISLSLSPNHVSFFGKAQWSQRVCTVQSLRSLFPKFCGPGQPHLIDLFDYAHTISRVYSRLNPRCFSNQDWSLRIVFFHSRICSGKE